MGVADRIRANRAARAADIAHIAELDAELVELVNEGLAEKIPAVELAKIAGVSRARIYQIKEGKR